MGAGEIPARSSRDSSGVSCGLSCTVVIPCWNAESSISAAIESVLSQEGVGVDCVVVDDGSTDNSLTTVQAYGGRVRWLAQVNQGACVARNEGAALSSAEYLLFLDADDCLAPQALSSLCQRAQNARADMVVGARLTSDGEQTRLEVPGNWKDAPGLTLEILKSGKCPQTATMLWRRDFFGQIGGWNKKVLQGQDLELTLRALCSRPRLAKSEAVSVVYDDTANPRRMAFLRGEAYDASHLDYLSAIESELVSLTGEAGRHALARHYYGLARRACRYGWIESGRRALKMARNLGLRNHPGNLMHQTVSGLIGLWSKERLAARLAGRGDMTSTATGSFSPSL
jgi:glycosyltransferase involved in cell wall biosynthesis